MIALYLFGEMIVAIVGMAVAIAAVGKVDHLACQLWLYLMIIVVILTCALS